MVDACHPSCCAFRISAEFAMCVAYEPTRRHRIVGDCHLRRCHRRHSQPLSALILSVLLLLMRIVQRTSAQTVEPMAMLRARSRRTQRCQGPHRESVQVYANRRALECDRYIPTRPCKSSQGPHTPIFTTWDTSSRSTCHWANATLTWSEGSRTAGAEF